MNTRTPSKHTTSSSMSRKSGLRGLFGKKARDNKALKYERREEPTRALPVAEAPAPAPAPAAAAEEQVSRLYPQSNHRKCPLCPSTTLIFILCCQQANNAYAGKLNYLYKRDASNTFQAFASKPLGVVVMGKCMLDSFNTKKKNSFDWCAYFLFLKRPFAINVFGNGYQLIQVLNSTTGIVVRSSYTIFGDRV